jgi:putative transposase
MDEQRELRARRRALRLWTRGDGLQDILRKVGRSKGWFHKWRSRYRTCGWEGLKSQSRRAHHYPTTCSARLEQLIVQTRQRLVRAKIGLRGPTAIQRELQKLDRTKPPPSCATIKRVLHRHGLIRTPKPRRLHFPAPLENLAGILQASDWTCRYLEAGAKVYAFHTLDLHTRSCNQTLARDKTIATVRQHFVETWQTLGIPDYLQLDNDAAFCGGYKVPRVFGQTVRLCLYLGIELIFLPVAEPERNGAVEHLNGLWQRAAWNRTRFKTFAAVERTRPKFLQWYMTDYCPPALAGQTPEQAQHTQVRHCLTKRQATALPAHLPITAGRIHFLRQVAHNGTISLLNETWRVGRHRGGKYIWATIDTRQQQLDIWYQASAHKEWQLVKSYPYPIAEPIVRRKVNVISS